MKILEYSDVDPLSVLHLTMLALDFALTPEYAAHIQQTDPRPFPCFTVNAVEEDRVLGQVGVFRLPMISMEGREDVGGVWAMSTHLQIALVMDALRMAIQQRHPEDVIHHSDQGSQYTSLAFGQRCRDAGVRPSMGSVGDCFDNALCESFFATLECELLDRSTFHNQTEARQATFEFIEGWYHPHRRHSALDYLSPNRYEVLHARTPHLASPHVSTETG